MGHQFLVGSVACGIGLVSLAAAIQNTEWFFQLAKMRLLQECVGRGTARWICGLLGCGLIALGLCIAAGLLPRKMPVAAANSHHSIREYGAWLPC